MIFSVSPATWCFFIFWIHTSEGQVCGRAPQQLREALLGLPKSLSWEPKILSQALPRWKRSRIQQSLESNDIVDKEATNLERIQAGCFWRMESLGRFVTQVKVTGGLLWGCRESFLVASWCMLCMFCCSPRESALLARRWYGRRFPSKKEFRNVSATVSFDRMQIPFRSFMSYKLPLMHA